MANQPWYSPSSLIHAAGNVVGGAAHGAGTAYDYLTPGKGSSTLTNVGAAITNPYVTLEHPSQIGGGGQSAFVYHAPAKSSTATQPTANQSTNPTTVYQPGSTNPYADASYAPAYNTYGSEAHTALNDLLNSFNQSNAATNSKYATANNALQSGYNQSKQNYDQSVTGANQDLVRQENSIRQGTNQAYHNLMNLLGAYGAGGSSTALEWAPEMASKSQTLQLQGADQNNANNLQTLASNWNTYQTGFDNEKKQNQDALNNALAQNEANYNATRSQLNDILGQIGNRAIDPTTIGSNLDSIRSSIPNMKFVQPTYTGTTPTYATPQLSTFETAAPATQLNTQLPSNSSTTPALLALLQTQQKKNDQLQAA